MKQEPEQKRPKILFPEFGKFLILPSIIILGIIAVAGAMEFAHNHPQESVAMGLLMLSISGGTGAVAALLALKR